MMAQKVTSQLGLSPPVPAQADNAALVNPVLPMALEQLQVLERLRQLRAWQQQQQDSLLRRQQEQLARLRSEQEGRRRRFQGEPHGGSGDRSSTTDDNVGTSLRGVFPPNTSSSSSVAAAQSSATSTDEHRLIASQHPPPLPSLDADANSSHQAPTEGQRREQTEPTIHHGAAYAPHLKTLEEETSAHSPNALARSDSSVVGFPHVGPHAAGTSDASTTGASSQGECLELATSEDHFTGREAVAMESESMETVSRGTTLKSRERESDAEVLQPLLRISSNGLEGDRPLRPGVGTGPVTTFEELVERQLRLDQQTEKPSVRAVSQKRGVTSQRTFLKRGEGIARFGVKKLRLKRRGNSQSPSVGKNTATIKPVLQPPAPEPEARRVEQPTSPLVPSISRDSLTNDEADSFPSDFPQRPTYVRKVAQSHFNEDMYSSNESLNQAPLRVSTPAMIRCSSEDSFLVRKDQRQMLEEAELMEFEMLEMAADENSFSSQNSLVLHVLTSGHPLTPEPRLPRPTSSTSHSRPSIESPLTTGREQPSEMKTDLQSGRPDANGYISNPEDGQGTRGICSQTCSTSGPPTSSLASLSDSSHEEDLDETLKPSLAAGVDFNDEEAWESFNQGSPLAGRHQQSVSSGSVTPDGSVLSAPWSSPVKREQLDQRGRTVFSSPLPTATLHGRTAHEHAASSLSRGIQPSRTAETNDKMKFTSERGSSSSAALQRNPNSTSDSTTRLQSSSTPLEIKPPECPTGSGLANLPPPSALVSKLFPALRKEREESKKQALQQLHITTTTPAGVTNPSMLRSLSTTSQDSGRGSGRSSTPSPPSSSSSITIPMNEELRQKLCQLETEIERFRAENSNLEKLRIQKEQELTYLKQEVAEFDRQKTEEIAAFEVYKKEEVNKLKKDRRVFEAYQHEARAARDKKDKEEIEALRNELQELREELQRREARWSASLARYRLRVEALEAQNRELQGDLLVMEQERLTWWQQQVQEKEVSRRAKQLPKQSDQGEDSDPTLHGEDSKMAAKDTDRRALPIVKGRKSSTKSARISEKKPHRHTEPSSEDKETVPRRTVPKSRVIEVVCQDIGNDDAGSDADSDLSAVAEDIVGQVLSENFLPRSNASGLTDLQNRTSKDFKESDAKKAKKSVRFSVNASPVAGPSQPEGEQSETPHAVSKTSTQREITHPDGKIETVEDDGSKVILFPNKTRKVVSADGKSISVHFFNGDIKHVKPDQSIVYYYADSKTTHTTYPDGLEVLEFPNNQSEKHYPNGTKEILFPDRTRKYVYPSGEEESLFPDGTIQRLQPNGDRTIEFANGQREYHTLGYKRREYPDGTVKTVYPDGRQKTRYASGRVRVKDKSGNVLVDKIEQQ